MAGPLDLLKKATSGIKFESEFLDTLVGSKLRNVGEAAEDAFYGMFGSFGMAVLDAKEKAEVQREIGEKVKVIFPFEKLKKKLIAQVIKKLNRRATASFNKDRDQKGRINEAIADIKKGANDVKELAKAIMAAVRLEPSIMVVIDNIYEETADDESFNKTMETFDVSKPEAAASIKQILLNAKQAEFQQSLTDNPENFSEKAIEEHKQELQKIASLKPEDLKDFISEFTKGTPEVKEQIKEAAVEITMAKVSGKIPEIQIPDVPSVSRGGGKESKPAVSKGRPKGAKDKAPRVKKGTARENLASMATGFPMLQGMLAGNTGDNEMLGGLSDELTSEFQNMVDTMNEGQLYKAMERLEGALLELADMLSTGELNPVQLAEGLGIETEDIESDGQNMEQEIEQQEWQDEMLENISAINKKTPFLTKSNNSEDSEDKGLLNKLFDGFKGLFDVKGLLGKVMNIFKMVGPMLSGLGSALTTAITALGPALAVMAAGFAGYKLGEWLNSKFNLSDKLLDAIDTVKGWFGESDEDNMKEGEAAGRLKYYNDAKAKGQKISPQLAKQLADDGVKVDPAMVKTEQEMEASRAAHRAQAKNVPPEKLQEEQAKNEALKAEQEGKQNGSSGNVVTMNNNTNNTIAPPKANNTVAPRTSENSVQRAKDRALVYR